jgi:hypothetical protein
MFHLYCGGQFHLVEETEVHGENNRPAANHGQTLSHNVVSSTPRHERDSNYSHH